MNLQENLVKYEKQFALISWIQCHTCLPEADSLSRIVGHELSNHSLTVPFKGMNKEMQRLSKFTSYKHACSEKNEDYLRGTDVKVWRVQ